MSARGRYFEMRRAVDPDSVNATIAPRPRLAAASTHAWAVAEANRALSSRKWISGPRP